MVRRRMEKTEIRSSLRPSQVASSGSFETWVQSWPVVPFVTSLSGASSPFWGFLILKTRDWYPQFCTSAMCPPESSSSICVQDMLGVRISSPPYKKPTGTVRKQTLDACSFALGEKTGYDKAGLVGALGDSRGIPIVSSCGTAMTVMQQLAHHLMHGASMSASM